MQTLSEFSTNPTIFRYHSFIPILIRVLIRTIDPSLEVNMLCLCFSFFIKQSISVKQPQLICLLYIICISFQKCSPHIKQAKYVLALDTLLSIPYPFKNIHTYQGGGMRTTFPLNYQVSRLYSIYFSLLSSQNSTQGHFK